MTELRGKTVVVVGLAKSGHAAIDLLMRNGARVVAVDEKPREQFTGVPVPVMPQTEASFAGADLIVLSPGVPADIPPAAAARKRGVPVIGEAELAGWFLKGPVLGVTGSNGKTTTTSMIGHVLGVAGISRQVGGNIGTPPTAMIDSSHDDQWNVLELSSFQLETIETFRAQIGVSLNVTPDHLDRHYTFEKYANAKARLFHTQTADDYAVLNADDPTCVGYAGRTRGRVWWFSRTGPATNGAWVERGQMWLAGEQLMKSDDIPLRGAHNVENALAASVASKLVGAATEAIAEGIRSFPGVEHRLEFVRDRNGVLYYNDSKATNVDAAEKAIDAFDGRLWIILGGKDKNSDYTSLREKLRAKARRVLLIGAAAEKIAAQLNGLPVSHCGTLARAVETAARGAMAGDIVLLAPACASFDQFENYEHRGRVFKEAVKAL
jgi:UDP-N-acetylmuramoylalanine--D-glutamate ligase